MGDALAVALMEARGFAPENFARLHPGGSLGRRLLELVTDVMITRNLPWVSPTAGILDVIRQITKTTETIPIQRAYDFRFAREADRQLTQSGWRP